MRSNDIVFTESYPIYKWSEALSKVKTYSQIETESPIHAARKNAVNEMFDKYLKPDEQNRKYSTRMMAHTLFDLECSKQIKGTTAAPQYGPRIFGNRSQVDKSIQPYRVFTPAKNNADVDSYKKTLWFM